MSKFLQRTVLGLCFLFAMVACGGGGGGGGGGSSNSPASSSAPLDSDKDGVPDSSDAFPNDASETKDTDKDGVGDNADLFPNDATESKDSDKDGVGDNGDAFPNDATETKDSDKDGVGDNKDLFPNDATETVDADKDGIGDNSDTTPLGPVIPAWATYQGNAQHTGWVDITLNHNNFRQRWSKLLSSPISKQGAAGDGYIFLNSAGTLRAIHAHNGETAWSRVIDSNSSSYTHYQPAYADGIVYVQSGNMFLWAFNAVDGSLVFQRSLYARSDYFSAPVVHDGTVYILSNYYLLLALDAKTGSEKWSQTIRQSDQGTPAVSGEFVMTYSGNYLPELRVMDRQTGNLLFTITDPDYQDYGWNMDAVPVISGNYAIVNHRGRLLAFNFSTGQLAWKISSEFAGQAVIKGDRIYIINDGVLETRSLSDGVLVSSVINSHPRPFLADVVSTNNLLFLRDELNVYAYQFDGTLVWTLANKSGGLMLSEGALIINTATEVLTIDVQGDSDVDGLPDWWENRYKKNIDPAVDADSDGLTVLEEFTALTNPLAADTDGDGLNDAEEVKDYKTSPIKTDTDGDGINDFVEVKTHNTDPAKMDTDADSLTDAEEVAAGLNPLDGNDALADNDGDGFSNTHELRANTGVNDANSRPQATEWSMQSGNAGRTSYSPLLLDDTRFSERWTTTNYLSVNAPVTTGDRLIVRNSNGQYLGWDSGDGSQRWGLPATNAHNLSSAADKVVYFTNTNNVNQLTVINAATGTHLFSKPLNNTAYYSSPLVHDGKVYVVDETARVFNAYSAATGDFLWNTAASNNYLDTGNRHLAGNGQLIGVGSNSLQLFSATNGSLIRTINLTSSYINSAILGSRNNVVIHTQDNELASVSTESGARHWTSRECSPARMALGNGNVYVLAGNNKLCVLDERTGILSWSLATGSYWNLSNLVVTASHLFYSDGSYTYAVNLATKSVSWSIAKGGSELALAGDGTLYVLNGTRVTAIDTEGDTDNDGLLQWWERRYGGDLVATADVDNDGLTNLQEATHKTNPLVADTDGDGLNDGQEVNTTLTNPLVADSDKDGLVDGVEVGTHDTDPLSADSDDDGIDDAREINLGLDALDADDAFEDNDSDGFTNRDEVFADTNLNDAISKPEAGDWATRQANGARNGFQPYSLDDENFKLRWSKTFSSSITEIATGANQVFLSQGSSAYSLLALNAVDGKQTWSQDIGQSNGQVTPVYHNDQVSVRTQNALRRFAAVTGTAAPSINLAQGAGSNRAVFVGDDAYFVNGYGYSTAYNMDTGANVWTSTSGSNGYDIAVNDQYLFYNYSAFIHVLDRTTGANAFSIDTRSNDNHNSVLGSRNNILIRADGLTSFDINSRGINWRIQDNNYYYNDELAIANGQVYYLKDQSLTSVDEVTGATRWSWQPESGYLSSNVVATLSHIFVASESATYALSASTGELLWRYDAGGKLALGADGALYIQSSRQLVAISLEGDSDSDGMPDWWERLYGLDIDSAADAALDQDSDGLTNLEEFTYKTYADQADSDRDGVSDLEEVNTRNTDPTSADSDSDGMPDGWEITNNFDPLDAADRDQDTDGDTVPNYFEFLVNTDPNNALSLPGMFNPGVYSFEDAALPSGWVLSADTTDVSITLGNASHGTKALQMRNKADISFVGFFMASDLSFDVKSSCGNYNNNIQIYVDDQLMANTYAQTQWSTLKTVIPLGLHTISIRSNSYSCSLYLDNVVIAPAQSNSQLGIQFVGLSNNLLQFVNADRLIVRTLRAAAPTTELSSIGLAPVGNEKLAVLFSGNETRLGVLDLSTFNWRYFGGIDRVSSSYNGYSYGFVARGNFAYVATRDVMNNTDAITRINLTSGAITEFGARNNSYTSLALDQEGYIHAYSNDGKVYKYDPTSLTSVSDSQIVTAQQILLDSDDRLIALSNNNEVVRYNEQRLIEARISALSWPRSIAVTERNELLIAQSGQLLWFAADWIRSETLPLNFDRIATFPQPDSDTDGLPDWWELAFSLNIADAADAALDNDIDGLTALEEYAADTDPGVDDTDGDLLSDGDELKDYSTNPNNPDTDADALTDAEEVLEHQTNPLLKDSDGDLLNDYLEVNQFNTDPNDASSKPAALVNFVESFENAITGWLTPSNGAHAGWTQVSDAASAGSMSLRSGAIGDSQRAETEWSAFFNNSTFTFDSRVSSEDCCDHLYVYLDDELVQTVYSNESNGQWVTKSFPVPAGFHTVRFMYRKDGSIMRGSDSAWVDNIRVQ